MEGFGEFLRKGREKAGVSLDDLSRRTRIRIENLTSLEKEDLENLPSDAYVRGFLRQVCREIGLSPNDAIIRYEMVRAQSGPPDEITWAEERVDETPGRLERVLEDPERVVRFARSGGRWAGAVLAIAAILLVLVVGWRVIRGDASGSTSEVQTRTVPNVAEPAKPEPPPSVQTSQTQASSPPVAEKTPEKAPERTPEKAPEPGQPPASVSRQEPPKPKPVDHVAATEAGAASVPTPMPSMPPANRAADTGPSSKLLLEVVAVRTTEISVMLDGAGQPRRATLAAGERRQWKADRFFDLTAVDGGAVRLILNGQDLGPAGSDGQGIVRSLSRTAH
jgi:cytoskeleton protein RodZ